MPRIDDARVSTRSVPPLRAGVSRLYVFVAVAAAGLAGCASSARLDARVTRLSGALAEAEAHGGMRCAPRELAIAQSQLEFARLEREQGDAARALAHLDTADENVRAAQLLSAPGRCEDTSEASDARHEHRTPARATGPALRRSHAR
jgi:OmpA-OmpF porin, OOP family